MEQNYICAICGKSHNRIEDRMSCEQKCLNGKKLLLAKAEQEKQLKKAEILSKEILGIDKEIASLQNLRKDKEEEMDKYQKYFEVPDEKYIRLIDSHFANLFGSLGL